MSGAVKRAAVFGMVDGLTCGVGVLMSLHAHASAVTAALLGVAIAEMIGMAAGEFLSRDKKAGLLSAAVIGAASAVGALIPAIPYWVTSGTSATVAAVVAVIAAAGVLTWMRREPGDSWIKAALTTYGILGAVFLVTGLVS